MQLEEFLAHRAVGVSDIVEAARARLDLTDDDVLFVCGSLLEGLGNATSDVDLYLLTSRTDFNFTSLDAVLLAVGPCLVDVRVVPHAQMAALLSRFGVWNHQPRQARDALGFSHDERTLLHRLHYSQPLHGQHRLEILRGEAPLLDLARHKLDLARCYTDALQVDLAGLRQAGDPYTMVFTSQELLSHGVDGVLAALGQTNPNGKWRVRQLADVPIDAQPCFPGRPFERHLRDEYVRLHRAPDLYEVKAVHAHALEATSFTRRMLLFAERKLVSPRAPALPHFQDHAVRSVDGTSLPHLDLDVTIRGDSLEILRLQGSGEVISLSPESAALLCLFDGQTSMGEAVASADVYYGEGQGKDVIQDLIAFVDKLQLCARPMIDMGALSLLLGRTPV